MLLQACDEGFQTPEDVRLDAVADARSIDFPADEPGVLQDLEVLRHGGLRERKLVDDVAADAGVAADQEPQDLDAGRVADRLAQNRELLVRFRALDRAEVRFLLRP